MLLSFGPKHSEPPFELPRGRSEIDFRVRVDRPGDFAATVKLFLEDAGLRVVPLSLHGRAIARKQKNSFRP